jgi:hypothetical protein
MSSQNDPYLYYPHLDQAIAQFRKDQGDVGWVTKVPNGEGFVFIHVKEADWETYRRAFRTLMLPMRALGDEPKYPTNVARAGILVKCTFENRSKEPFVRDWPGRDKAFDMVALFCQDLEKPWFPRFDPEKLLVKKVDEGIKRLMWPKLEVPPGGSVEKLFLLRPDEDFKETIHGHHLVAMFFVIPWEAGDGIAPGTLVAFPFYNPDREVPNATVELQVDPVAGETAPAGFVLPPMQIIREKKGLWITEGLARFGSTLSDDRPLIMVKAIRTKPGPPGDVLRQAVWKAQSFTPGYDLPTKVLFYNDRPPVGGQEPRALDDWVEYSFRDENTEKAAWEATPLKQKMEVAGKLLASSDPDDRYEGLGIIGKYANEGYLDMVLPLFDDPEEYVGRNARKAYAKIVGMTYEDHQAMLAAQVAERQRIVEIARREGRVTNILIKDSVLQRTNIGIVDGGESNVKIEDSVVTKSNLDGKTEVKSSVVTRTNMDGDTEITDSVVVRHQTKDGEKVVEDVRVGPGPKPCEAEESYEVRLAKYEKALKKALADGTITEQEKKLLEALRKKFGISQDEHEMMLEMLK